jgi:hypothetical protein
MLRRLPYFLWLVWAMAILSSGCQNITMTENHFNQIQQAFTKPQEANRVWCYYYWIGDDISKEGVSRDLEAMKAFGIGAVLIGNINPEEKDGPVPLFSPKWWDIIVHVVNEGKRLGIDIGFFNCPGWSQSGGPWVTFDKAMRHLVYSETDVMGAATINILLQKPAQEFQDVKVLAFKKITAERERLDRWNACVTVKPIVQDAINWLDANPATEGLFTMADNAKYDIEIIGRAKLTARSILLYPARPNFKCKCDVYAWLDGQYQLIRSFAFDRSNVGVGVGPVTHGPVAISLPETVSARFKLVCSEMRSNAKAAGFSDINITASRVLEKYVEKSLGKMHPTPTPLFDSYMWPVQASVSGKDLEIGQVFDISDHMNASGQLNWEAPPGEWTVLRLGMTPTGTTNAPAAPQGKGYEIDKASADLARFHFEHYMAEIIKRVPPDSRSALKYLIADSYEMGSQNWTDGFEDKFVKKFGYSPIKYLPVISGRLVGSAEESDRFLWDLRRSIADDIAYQYVGGLRQVANENNMKLWLENYGHWGYPGEFLMYGGQSDLVSGEFWNEGDLGAIECKSASSAAHIYGKPVTSAESFTAANLCFKRHPALLKKRGDWCYTEGINHHVLHVYIQQPDERRIPGINAWFGTEFNRHNTWFTQARSYVDYLRRCQHLLQQGTYTADVCYFIGEDAPKMSGLCNPELPKGYAHDFINAEALLQRVTIQDGKFVLPDGMHYRLLVLPNIKTMRPKVLAKIEELVKQGGVLLGCKPEKSPSLENYPACDQAVQQIASKLWNDEYKNGKLIRRYGRGYILDGLSIQEALDLINVRPDFLTSKADPVLWTHRSLPGMEIYFITNQSDREITILPSFRVSGLKPQLWDAITGEIRSLTEFSVQGDRTVVPLHLMALQSWFVVFTEQKNSSIQPGYSKNFPTPQVMYKIADAWTVDFINKDIGPAQPVQWSELQDWRTSRDERIKYYSGTVVYTTRFNFSPSPDSGKFFINLGQVGVMAEVKINGKDLGSTWIAPFQLPLQDYLKSGENTLEITVVNTWRNRLIRDQQLPKEKRYTWTTVNDIKPDETLTMSGLVGPVTIEMEK